ncbi:MAG: hypothetical protein IJ587_06920 [Synergistaceae bacterium]|nr:hypothetical protein [Synergistaceae bacterium]
MKLKEQIRMLTTQEAELLKKDKLPKRLKNATGLYLTCDGKRYTGYDYSERQAWIESFETQSNAPKGWSKEFSNPLDAIDWLFELKQ